MTDGGAEPAFVTATVERLREVRTANAGRLPAGWVDEAAAACGVGRSTMLRYLAQGAPASRGADPPWSWGPTARAAYYRAAGNVTLARRMLEQEEGTGSVASLSTMYRAAARDFAPDEQALARLGERAARGKRLVCSIENVHRNEVWLSDHKLLDVFVVLPRGKTPVRPWMTVLIDGYSRRAVGASLSVTPNRGHVLSALAMAIEQCGIPEMLVFDRGREFLSHAVAEHASALGYAAVPTLAYHPHHKGKVERFHQTLNRNLAADLGVVPQPATDIRDANLVGPRRPVSMALMAERFFEVVRQYNECSARNIRSQSRLGGGAEARERASDHGGLLVVRGAELEGETTLVRRLHLAAEPGALGHSASRAADTRVRTRHNGLWMHVG